MKNLLSLILVTFLFVSCSSDSTENLTVTAPDSVTYTASVKAIVDQSCATTGCHNSTTSQSDLILENYTQVKNAFENRNALERMESTNNPMPASGNLPITSIEIVKKWRNQGYLQ